MPKDDKKPRAATIFDIAREAGVSYSTVSRTLNGYEFVKASTRERVLRAAEKLGYVPNQQARSLAGGRSNLIGILVPTLGNSYVTEIIHGIDEALAESDYNLILYTTRRHQGKESTYVSSIINGAADGLLLVVPLISTSYLDVLRQQEFPFVLIDQIDRAQQSPVVKSDNRQGAYKATEYLINMGHERIGFITGLAGLHSAVERFEGYKAALRDYGISLREEYIVGGDFRMRVGYMAAQKLLALAEPPTAIFSANDLSALGAMEAVRDQGLHIPGDISVVGFDDIPPASTAYPKLTTVQQPLNDMGHVAVKMLLERLENPLLEPRDVVLRTQLVIRDSCQSPKRP